MTSPATYARWILPETSGFKSLQLDRQALLDSPSDDEVLVELHAASLNYRDLMIAKGAAPGEVKKNAILGSDGAGEVKVVGRNVTRFKAGDRVVAHMIPLVADGEFPTFGNISDGLGQGVEGTLRELGFFHESTLVHAPKNLNFKQAATLTCSGLTAWNALFGLQGREVRRGDWVLVQGTGGVSIAALQFALAVGANIVATTSSDAKASRLRELGAKHIVNYRTSPAWSEEARKFTPENRGFDIVVDVGGDSTLEGSLKASRRNGLVVASGVLGSGKGPVPMLAALWHLSVVRGILLGTRDQFADMVKFIEEKDIKPALDDVVFDFAGVPGAFERMEAQQHFSKVVIALRPQA